MAKIFGIQGVLSGKVGNTIYAIRPGMTIARQYNPSPLNIKSEAQVEARAKFKLLSQLAAVMAGVIAIPKEGIISSRNLFTKKNYGLTSFTNNEASITLADVQLTNSVIGLPEVVVTRGEGTAATFSLASAARNISRIVYCAFLKQPDDKLRFAGSYVVSEAGASGRFEVEAALFANSNYVVYAYGVRDNTASAAVIFGELEAVTAETVAKLLVTRRLTEADVSLTETKGVEVPRAGN